VLPDISSSQESRFTTPGFGRKLGLIILLGNLDGGQRSRVTRGGGSGGVADGARGVAGVHAGQGRPSDITAFA